MPDAHGIIAGTTTTADDCGDARKRNRIKPSVLGGRGAGRAVPRQPPQAAAAAAAATTSPGGATVGRSAPRARTCDRANACARVSARANPRRQTRIRTTLSRPFRESAHRPRTRPNQVARVLLFMRPRRVHAWSTGPGVNPQTTKISTQRESKPIGKG